MICRNSPASASATPCACFKSSATLSEADTFIKLRNSETAKPVSLDNSSVQIKNTSGDSLEQYLKTHAKDPEINQRYEALEKRLRHLLMKRIQTARTSYEVPPDVELAKMNANELMEVIDAFQIPFPKMIKIQVSLVGLSLPESASSKWKNMNTLQQLESIEIDLEKLEKETKNL
jgi:hypothetical protein